MTENELRARVCAQALAWKDRKEADGSHLEIINTYNTIRPLPRGYKLQPSDAWCAGFVSAVAQACGLTDILYPECGCDRMIALYKTAGRWMEDDAYLPQLAEVIFYDWQDPGSGDCTGGADHVGLVLQVDGETITVIEGNMSHKVGLRTLQRNGRYIRGYGRPDYASKADAAAPAEDPAEDTPAVVVTPDQETVSGPGTNAADYSLPLHQLRAGDSGEEVRAAQILLIGRGYTCGPDGADGVFGANTRAAAMEYQWDKRLVVDGIIGPKTMGALHGIDQ